MTVADVMTTAVITVGEDAPLKDVARLLVEHGISGLPVVDAVGHPVGVISETDLVLKEAGTEAVEHRRFDRILGQKDDARRRRTKAEATTAAEAMSSPPITISPQDPIGVAAREMTGRRVDRLLVIDDGRLVGIVSRADLVRAFVRSDEELIETIREEVLHRLLWLDPAAFVVGVVDGVATIEGHVEQRSTAEMIQTTVGMVPGIVDVEASVSWRVDDSDVASARIDPFFRFGQR
jgi:CBS domain-containing protein